MDHADISKAIESRHPSTRTHAPIYSGEKVVSREDATPLARDDKKLKVVVIFEDGKIAQFRPAPTNTIHDMKMMIQNRKGIEPKNFSLVWKCELLEDEKTLSSYNIRKNTWIRCLVTKKTLR